MSSSKPVLQPEICLSLAATPFLFGIMAIRGFSQALADLGIASEEIFRGEILPVLHFPDTELQKQEER